MQMFGWWAMLSVYKYSIVLDEQYILLVILIFLTRFHRHCTYRRLNCHKLAS